jgi:hypothetical protein
LQPVLLFPGLVSLRDGLGQSIRSKKKLSLTLHWRRLAEVGKSTRWPPGQSGNPGGKPPGTRTAFSQGFIRDFALVWAEEGLEAVRKVAKKSPESFVAIAARICPNDVRLTLEQAIPGGMSLEDYSLMREVIGAIRKGLPEGDQSLMDVFRR